MAQPEPTVASPVKSPRRFRFRSIWLAPLLALLALGAWAFASPPGSSPDDDFHAVSIWCAAEGRTDLCEPGATATERRVSTALTRVNCYTRDPEDSGRCYLDIAADPEFVETARGNFVGAYPPVYYAVMSLFISDDVATSLLVMRFVNIVLFIAMTSLLFWLLPRNRRPTLVWAWLASIVPLGLFLVASNNPSAWTIIGVGSVWLAVLGFFETTTRARFGLAGLAVAGAVMAAGSRADGAIYAILVTGAVLVLVARRDRGFLRALWLPGVVVAICLALLLVSAQITSSINGFDTPSVTSDPGVATPDVPAEEPNVIGLLFYNILNTPSLWAGVFGSWPLGWFDTALPAVVSFGAVAVFVAVCFSGIRDLTWRKLVVVVATVVGLWVIPVVTLTRGLDHVGVEVQPRYIYPLIIALAGFCLLTTGPARAFFTRIQSILLMVALSGTASVALYFVIRRYVTGVDVAAIDLDAGAEWWWSGAVPGPMATWILGSLAWIALVVVTVRAVTGPRSIAPLALRQ